MKPPKYPIETSEPDPVTQETLRDKPPPGLYLAPSFKHRHELRAPLESAEDSFNRAYPPRVHPRRGAGRRC
jgi:hypothetical protein